MWETLMGLALVVGILVLSALVTTWYARGMYNRCAKCGILNAKRRTHCRICKEKLS